MIEGGPVHHIATNKHYSKWTPEFARLFKSAGLDLEATENKVRVPGHIGRHPEAYHQYIWDHLKEAMDGLSGLARTKALLRALAELGEECVRKGSKLNRWITGG